MLDLGHRRLVLIDSRINNIDCIKRSTLDNVDVIMFDYYTETINDIQSRIVQNYESVCIAQHNYEKPYYLFVQRGQISFLGSSDEEGMAVESWSEYVAFLNWLKVERGVNSVDLLACNIWSDIRWRNVIHYIKQTTSLQIHASVNITGRDGDFIMESDDIDLIGLYFTPKILEYSDNFYYSVMSNLVTKSDSLDPPANIGLNGGKLSANKYASFLGSLQNCTTQTGTLKDIPSEINNVINFTYTMSSTGMEYNYIPYAYAALTASGEVVTWGSNLGGADISGFESNLSSGVIVVKSSGRSFTALKSDGTAYCWGYWTDGNPVNYTNSANIAPSSLSLTNINKIESCYINAWAALTNDGKVLVWGKIANWPNLSSATAYLNANCTKLVSSNKSFAALSGGIVVIWGESGTVLPNLTGITDIYPLDQNSYVAVDSSSNVYSIKTNGSTSLITQLNSGETILDCRGYSNTNGSALIHTNQKRLLKYFQSALVVYNNVSYYVTNSSETNIIIIQNGTMIFMYYGVVSGASSWIEENTNITDVKKIILVGGGYFVIVRENGSLLKRKATSYPDTTNFTEISTGVKDVFGCNNGILILKTDNTIVKNSTGFNLVSDVITWPGTPSTITDSTFSISSGENVVVFNTPTSFLMVDVSAQTVASPASITSGTDTEVTITSNIQQNMAYRNHTYKLYDNNSNLLSTYIPTADTYTYLFSAVNISNGVTSLSIIDSDLSANVYSYSPTVINGGGGGGGGGLQAPVINLLSGDRCLYVNYTCSTPNITGYKYSLNGAAYLDFSGIHQPFTVSGLTNRTRYSLTLKAVSSTLGTTGPSNTESVTIGAPQIPIITSVTPGDKKLTINFTYQNKNGTIYQINGTTNGGTTITKLTSVDTTTVIWGKLINGITLTPQIQVVNENGASEWSAPIGSFTPALVPSMLVIRSASITGIGQAAIDIAAPCDNGSPITKYQYSLNYETTLYDISGLTSPFTITGLENNITYRIRMYAVNGIGTSVASNPSAAIISRYAAPTEPTNLLSTLRSISMDVSGGALWYNGAALMDLSGTLLGSTSLGVSTSSMSVIYTSATTAVAFILETTFVPGTVSTAAPVTNYKYNLGSGSYVSSGYATSPVKLFVSPNTVYALKLKCVNAVGDSPESLPANSVSIKCAIPTTPAVVSCIQQGSGSVLVKIRPSVSNGVAITKYSYTLDNGANYVDMTFVSSNTYLASGLTNNVAITNFRIAAYCYIGYSQLSASKTFTILYAVPSAPIISTVSVQSRNVTIKYTTPSGNGSAITGYQYTLAKTGNSIVDSVGVVNQITVSDLTPGTYVATIKAINSLGMSASSTAKGFIVR